MFTLTRCKTTIAIPVEAPTYKVVKLRHDTIAIKVIAMIRYTTTLSRLLQLCSRFNCRWGLKPFVVSDLYIVQIRLVLVRRSMMLTPMNVIVRYHVRSIHIIHGSPATHPRRCCRHIPSHSGGGYSMHMQSQSYLKFFGE
jgi:hypothetical protein